MSLLFNVLSCHSFYSKKQALFNFMAALTICSDLGDIYVYVCVDIYICILIYNVYLVIYVFLNFPFLLITTSTQIEYCGSVGKKNLLTNPLLLLPVTFLCIFVISRFLPVLVQIRLELACRVSCACMTFSR